LPLQDAGGGRWLGTLAAWGAGAAGRGRQRRRAFYLRCFRGWWQTKRSQACPGVAQSLFQAKCCPLSFRFPAGRGEQERRQSKAGSAQGAKGKRPRRHALPR
jgi:hypothetical protein